MAQRDYGHLLSNAFKKLNSKKTAAEPKDTDDEHEGTPMNPPANDKEDGKKGKAKKSGKKAGEGDTDEEEEDKDSDEGETDEERETRQEEEEDEEEDDLDKKRGKKGSKKGGKKCAADVAADERLRIKTILSSEEAQTNPRAAMKLALDTGLPAQEALAFLSISMEAPPARHKVIDDRMNATRKPNVGIEPPSDQAAFSGNVTLAAMEKMTPAQKAKLISSAGAIRRGEASTIQEGLKKLAG